MEENSETLKNEQREKSYCHCEVSHGNSRYGLLQSERRVLYRQGISGCKGRKRGPRSSSYNNGERAKSGKIRRVPASLIKPSCEVFSKPWPELPEIDRFCKRKRSLCNWHVYPEKDTNITSCHRATHQQWSFAHADPPLRHTHLLLPSPSQTIWPDARASGL